MGLHRVGADTLLLPNGDVVVSGGAQVRDDPTQRSLVFSSHQQQM
jgi:hypothetical protein